VKVVLAEKAEADLREILAYVVQDNPVAAEGLLERIVNCVDGLAQFPQRGRPGRRGGTRKLVVTGTPCVVAYRVGADRVEVARVLHGARLWPRVL
jgi:toxin ParE1/3/4